MDFKTINFGKADAHTEGEAYPELLSKGYLNISSVAEKALNGNVFLFLGYKGSGKSSLSEHLRLVSGDAIVDQQQLKDFPFKEFDKILDTEDKIIRYKKLWCWLLCVKVFENLYFDSSAHVQSQNDLKKVVAIFTQAGIFPVLSISSLVKKTVTNSVKATIKCLELNRTVNKEDVGIGQDIDLLTDYLKNLILSFKEENQHVMIIDDLDDILSPKGLQFGIITSLINVVKELNRFFALSNVPFKILVLCRTDMFERLPDPNKNKTKQDCSFTFTWYREGLNKGDDSDLVKLINTRAKLVYPELQDVFKTFFPRVYKGTKIHTALLDFTRHTPRDFIQLINYIQNQCGDNTTKVTSAEIERGIKEYSTEYFKQEISDEMAGYLPGTVIEGVFNALSSLRSRDFWFSDFREKCTYNTKLKGVEADEIMKILYECSAIGHSYSYNGGRTSRVTFKYRNRSSSFNPEDRIMLHKGLWKALNVNY
ncbi:MAG: hypothetical protein IJL58_05850 [Bacteroidales bacterium]|nr:hypothetical protein [Bacteroidales bacterium]